MAPSYYLNSLKPSDAIWRHKSGSTLPQVMTCCLTAPSHYQNQCWLIISSLKPLISQGRVTYITLKTLTHWGRDKIAAISQMTFSNAFSWMKKYEFHLIFHRSLFLRFQLTIIQHWFRKWPGASSAISHCLTQWWLIYCRLYVSLCLNVLSNTCHHAVL